jgi:2-C-methyl-D-erythritol 4-phosphate cytidylyltransferase
MPSFGVILAAGGQGTRFCGGTEGNGKSRSQSKQFLELAGRPLYQWALQTFLEHPDISTVVVVVPSDMVADIKNAGNDLRASKMHVTAGGTTRQSSVFAGLKFLKENGAPDFVLIHDAARPFVSPAIVSDVIASLQENGACTVGITPSDTIQKMESNMVAGTLDRDQLILVQTPQAGRFEWLYNAHVEAEQKGVATTDDATLLERSGHRVYIVRGNAFNLKITHPADLELARAIASIVFTDRL